MVRTVLGVVGGFVAWMLAWFGGEAIVGTLWPAIGANQQAFQTAIEQGGQFTADTTLLLAHIVLIVLVSLLAGFVSVLIAGENRRAPIALAVLLLAMGVMKAVMSWPYVPVWYHVLFTTLLVPVTLAGARLRRSAA